jgi:hypothetical protein
MIQANNLNIKKTNKTKRSASMKLEKSECELKFEDEISEGKKRDASANRGQKSKRPKLKEDKFTFCPHQNDVEVEELEEISVSENRTYRIGGINFLFQPLIVIFPKN